MARLTEGRTAAAEAMLREGARISVPFLGAFSVGIARKAPAPAPDAALSPNAWMICGALLYTKLAASSFWFG
jgi:hypothetical protein